MKAASIRPGWMVSADPLVFLSAPLTDLVYFSSSCAPEVSFSTRLQQDELSPLRRLPHYLRGLSSPPRWEPLPLPPHVCV